MIFKTGSTSQTFVDARRRLGEQNEISCVVSLALIVGAGSEFVTLDNNGK
jgi:hypothetical protein